MNRMLRVPGFRVNEVNRVKNVVLTPSGKATNAARVLHRLGAAHQLITLVGGPREIASFAPRRRKGCPAWPYDAGAKRASYRR